jgi:AmmeMemoRadiSam system protein A
MNTPEESAHITEEQGQRLINIARRTIAAKLGTLDDPGQVVPDQDLAEPLFRELRGTFVTLKIKGQLRGCMGCLTPSESILEGIQRNAINSAFNDPRFPALTAEELAEAAIDISILTSPQELAYSGGEDLLRKLRPNIDGVIIKKAQARATFLPQVWEQLPAPQNFLAHLCQKAGLAHDEWQKGELDVSLYQVQYFNEQK